MSRPKNILLFCLVSLLALATAATAEPMWSDAGTLTEARHGQTATLLPSGKLLLTGGIVAAVPCTPLCPLASTELYDPVDNSWRAAASLTMPRNAHTATLLPNGKVLVVGGLAFSATASVELYDPLNNIWTTASSLATARSYHSATLLPNGNLLVVGGGQGSGYPSPIHFASAEIYDPISDTWRYAGSLKTARRSHSATILSNGKVLVVGGYNPNLTVRWLASAELYDPATDTWGDAGSLTTARQDHTATLLRDGRVLVAGGYNDDTLNSGLAGAEIYDPVTNSWSQASSLASARRYFTATLLADGRVLVAGGYNGDLPTNAELYDPSSNSWTFAGSLLFARADHTAALLHDGKVLLAGGNRDGVPFRSAELYDPATPGSPLTICQNWNLLGNSGGSALDVTPAFADATKVVSVWKWVAAKTAWAFYSPQFADGGVAYAASNGFDALTTINSGEGFWVNAKVPFAVSTPNGTLLASAFQANLPSGWSLISIGEEKTASDFNKQLAITPPSAGTIPNNTNSLWAWDSSQSKWYFYAPSLDAQGATTLGDYAQSKGYLDFAATGNKLGPGVGFWVNKP